jgi:hypothetical protein
MLTQKRNKKNQLADITTPTTAAGTKADANIGIYLEREHRKTQKM